MTTKIPSWDPFAELGIATGASDQEIEQAFRRQAKLHHPDVSKAPDAATRLARIKEARDLLADDATRRALATAFGKPAGFRKVSDAFDDVFEAFGDIERDRGAGMRSGRRSRGQDVERRVGITLEQAFAGFRGRLGDAPAACEDCSGSGKVRTDPHPCTYCSGVGSVRKSRGLITLDVECTSCDGKGVTRVATCRSCGGSGQVQGKGAVFDVPAGVRDGMEIVLRGMGMPGIGGGASGDLSIVIALKPHPVFRRKDSELSARVAVPVWDAANGCTRTLTGVDGRQIAVSIPAGTRGGTEIVVAGEGMPDFPGRGALRVRIDVDVPCADTPELKAAFEALRRAVTSREGAVSAR